MATAGGAATLTTLIQGFSVELATLLVAAIISSYTFMGGLGAAFYMSYFNSAAILILIVIFLVKIFYDNSSSGVNVLGLAYVLLDHSRLSFWTINLLVKMLMLMATVCLR